MDSLLSMVRTFIRQGRTPEEATDMALDRAPARDLRAMVRPVMIAQAQRIARDVVRKIEGDNPPRPSLGMSGPESMRALLASTFVLPDGTRVPHGQATAEQHRMRAEMYATLAGQNMAKAERHQRTADMLERTGASCLDDLYAREGESAELPELAA